MIKKWSRIEDQNLINAVNDNVTTCRSSSSSSNRNNNNNNDHSNHVVNKINWINIAKQLGTNRSSTACLRRYKRHLIPLMKKKNLKVRK